MNKSFDPDVFGELLGTEIASVVELLVDSCEKFDAAIDAMQIASDQDDLPCLSRLAHSMAGGYGSLGAAKLVTIIRGLEASITNQPLNQEKRSEFLRDIKIEALAFVAEVQLYVQQTSAEKKQESIEVTRGAGPLVFIIDDDDRIVELLSTILVKKGCRAVGLASLSAARSAMLNSQPDLILLDVNLPDGNGFDLLKEIRNKYDPVTLPVLVVTGLSDDNSIMQGLKCGANDYIQKPLKIDIASHRIMNQIMLKDHHRRLSESRELESLHAMVVTYNHEINNPLMIALGRVEIMLGKEPTEDLKKLETSLNRIKVIVKKIALVVESHEITKESYTSQTLMIKLG